MLVAAPNVSIDLVTVAIATAYLAANAPRLTVNDVIVNVTRVQPIVDKSGSVAINSFSRCSIAYLTNVMVIIL